jgi:cation:H+ antiporter
MLAVWLQFFVCSALILVAGVRLSRYADIIAATTGLSGSWVGVVLLATVTSLPELATGVSAVTVAGAPNIALGDLLGSCVFNLVIITVLDFLQREESVFSRASQGHILSAAFGVILIGFAGFNILLEDAGRTLALGHVGIYTPIIVLLYGVGMRTVFLYERRQLAARGEEVVERHPDVTLRAAVIGYTVAALVVVAAGTWLPFVGERLAEIMQWRRSFVGTLFVAAATSLPEVAVTIGAFRVDALDMAIGNLLGSNMLDIFLIAVDDLFYLPGPLLGHVDPVHVVSALSAVMMTGVAIVGLLYRPKRRLFRTVGWASLFLFSLYLLNSYLLFLHGE